MSAIAYDYVNQRWIEGAEAKEIRLAQIREELEILTSEDGWKYARFIGQERRMAVAALRAEASRLGWQS